MDIYTDFPDRLKLRKVIYAGKKHVPLTIRSRRPHQDGLLLAFEEIETPEAVGQFRNQLIYTARAERPKLAEDQYYHDQILGFQVFEEGAEEPLGVLEEVMQTGANDVFLVKNPDGKEYLLPVIADVVRKIDLDKKMIRVHLLPGLMQS